MRWDYWITLYTQGHCVPRGLRPLTISAYEKALRQFQAYAVVRLEDKEPDQIVAKDVLDYVRHLREERGNHDSAINRTVTILRNFYRAIVALGHMDPPANPMVGFPKIKAVPKKLPVVLSTDEVKKLLEMPPTDTVLGLRDRALLTLLYGTGIRASECARVTDGDIDLSDMTIMVTGKGGHQRTIPLNDQVGKALRIYRQARGMVMPTASFFATRSGRSMSRGAVYERVRSWARRARISKVVSPHRLRHTFATHLVKAGVGLVTIRDLLGHRQITSTQIYLHVTANDMREAADVHPVGMLIDTVDHLLPDVKLPIQHPPGYRGYG